MTKRADLSQRGIPENQDQKKITETLADGCNQCDFRFKKDGDLRISSKTPEVQETIERISQKEVH